MGLGLRLFFLSLSIIVVSAKAADCSGEWEVFSSKPYTQIALPDTNVNYWRYRFELPKTGSVVLKVTGRYPHSRYMNYNVYDQSTIDSAASLADAKIKADSENQNPFVAGTPRNVENRNYTLWVGPKEVLKSSEETQNVMHYPPAKVRLIRRNQAIELWYRIYLPDQNANDKGNVELPKIEALDGKTRQPIACPAKKSQVPPLWNAAKQIPPKGKNGELLFIASDGHGLYANGDNKYLTARFDFDAGPVAVIRFKAPGFPDTASGEGVFED